MFRDDEIFPMATRTPITETQDADPRINSNDDFDDVFGSAPPSPSPSSRVAIRSDNAYHSDSHDDTPRSANDEVSDIPRLKEKHQTEGYRDGVTAGKATSVQAGFDEGYGLGAVLGLKIGALLGLLEGLAAAVSKVEGLIAERARLQNLLLKARADLTTERVFGRQWWGEDGIWTFPVEGEGVEGSDVLFPDVVRAHPLVKKWQELVDAEINTWGLDLKVMDMEEAAGEVEAKPARKETSDEGKVLGAAKAELNW
ncbi:ABC1 domain containing protein [Phlyctema vagabunda]|uniref:Protein YAE1 n=1 Tax=Phlyctema vagabunda TaxID=108571 RepID=A0ABR4PAA9_9HELO